MKLSLRSLAVAMPLAVGFATTGAACGDSRSGFNDDPAANDSFTGADGGAAGQVDAEAGAPCLSQTLEAQPIPLAMLLVMDRSGSMASPSNGSKWDQARSAMIGFTDTKGAAGTKLGLTVFPPDTGAGDQCQPASYAPIVPIALLPGNGTNIKDALLSRSTTGSTPMAEALQGGVDAMTTYLASNANEQGVLILVTDGDPGACTGDTVSNVASIAQAAAKGTPRIRTFVVGMAGATFSNLDTIAAAGEGAPKAFNASGGGGDAGVSPQQQLLDALEKIRSGALGCEFVLPVPDASKGILDPSSVELDFSPGTNDPSQKIRRVDGLAACGATTGGFYYDDPAMPTRIELCPASCDVVRGGAASARVDVNLGCIKPVK